jgi:hypothetical protein
MLTFTGSEILQYRTIVYWIMWTHSTPLTAARSESLYKGDIGMSEQKTLDIHQQELVNIIKAAHSTLGVARKVRSSELARRIRSEKERIEREAEKAIDESVARVKHELDSEVAAHESALDEALIAAYNALVPIRRIALDGFGNRYDGGAHQLIAKLRDDGRIGNRVGYQGNGVDIEETRTEVFFPEPVNVESILAEATTIYGASFTALAKPLELIPATATDDAVTVQAVTLALDARDPWFRSIAKNARAGTVFAKATSCTLYLHPASGELVAHESRETGATTWDHPVARWAKDHRAETLDGFCDVIEALAE